MGLYFKYDDNKHKHRIFSFEKKDEKGQVIGYYPLVIRDEPNVVRRISEEYDIFKDKIFSTQEEAKDYAFIFFCSL